MDASAQRLASELPHCDDGPVAQIRFVGRDFGVGTGDSDLAICGRFEADLVGKIDRLKDGLDFVEAVASTPDNLERQVYFRPGNNA
jgi:hypothetical protein